MRSFPLISQITLDRLPNPLIMRPTSDVVETQNLLKFNWLSNSGSLGSASIPRSIAVETKVDSASKRCMIRLPLRVIAVSQVFEAKRVSRKKLQNKRLTANEESVECAPRLRRNALNQLLFNKSNQAIRVGACEYGLIVTKIISITSGHARNHIVI